MKLSAYEECFHPNVSKVATNGTNGSLHVNPTSKINLVRIYFMPCPSLGPNIFGLDKNDYSSLKLQNRFAPTLGLKMFGMGGLFMN